MSLSELTASSRVTVFPLEHLTVAYTTRSSDGRGLGDIGLVTVVDDQTDGDELWRLARDLGGRTQGADQARWILTQAGRARMVKTYTDLPDARWTAHIRRRFALGALFANHEVLMTGRIALDSDPRPSDRPHHKPAQASSAPLINPRATSPPPPPGTPPARP